MEKANLELLQMLLDYLKYNNKTTEKAAKIAQIHDFALEEAFRTLERLIETMRENDIQ